MFRIGEFSKMCRMSIKTLRYYDEIGLLPPEGVDSFTGYRLYTTKQLERLQAVQAMKQAGLSIREIKKILQGENRQAVLLARRDVLLSEIEQRRNMLSHLDFLLSEREEMMMKYQAIVKEIPEYTVYSVRMKVESYDALYQAIPSIGEKLMARYPNLECVKPEYSICIFHDDEFKTRDIDVEFCEAVTEMQSDFEDVHFKILPATRVLSVLHKGSYDGLFHANAFAYRWIEENGYASAGQARNNYIDGVWNKNSAEEWLTEIQIPIVACSDIQKAYKDTKAYAEWEEKSANDGKTVTAVEKQIDAFAKLRMLPPNSPEVLTLSKQW